MLWDLLHDNMDILSTSELQIKPYRIKGKYIYIYIEGSRQKHLDLSSTIFDFRLHYL